MRLFLIFVFCVLPLCSPAQEPPTPGEDVEPAGDEVAVPQAMEAGERQKLVTWLREAYSKPAAEWPAPTLDEGRPHLEIGTPSGPPPEVEGNPTTKEKKRLGLSLFFDVRLSDSLSVSCASCHEPQLGWSNGVAFSFGAMRQQITRHPPTLVGVAYHKSLFWDGRATKLEDQAADVIKHPIEMDGNPDKVVARLESQKEYYGPLFEQAFGDPKVTFERITQALAAFQRGILPGRSKFDKFAAGENKVFTDSELAGLHLFRTKARCMNCHMGPMFTDDEFHNVGLTYYGRRLQDLGRYVQTKNPDDVGRFRTATLRNVGRTAPYMHNGVFPSLEGVIRLYNAGMPRPRPKENQVDDPLFPKTSEHLKPLNLTLEEREDLKNFLMTLSEPPVRVMYPPVPKIGEKEGN